MGTSSIELQVTVEDDLDPEITGTQVSSSIIIIPSFDLQVRNLVDGTSYGSLYVNQQSVESNDTAIVAPGLNNFRTYSEILQNQNKFRNWSRGDANQYYNPTDLLIYDYSNSLDAIFNRTSIVRVLNNLEGGSGGNYQVTWDKTNIPEYIQSNSEYYVFPYLGDGDRYTISSPNFTTLNTTWQFLNWSDGTTSPKLLEAQQGTEYFYQAIYKGNLRTNSTTAITSNSQRKITRTSDGIYHMFYTSMGKLWYTYSLTTNYEGAWAQEESVGNDDETIKNPSVTSYGNDVYFTYELLNNETGQCSVYVFKLWDNAPTAVVQIESSFFGSSYPVICRNDNETIVIYKKSSSLGLYFKSSRDNFQAETLVPNTVSNSKNPSVSKMMNTDNIFHICWEENNQIKSEWSRRRTGTREFLDFSTPSSGSGFTTNCYPSLIGSASQGARITWMGTRNEWIEETQSFEMRNKVVFKDPSYYRFWNFGNNTNKPSINANYNNELISNYYYAWSENTAPTNTYPVKYGNSGLSGMQDAQQNGPDVQMIDGSGTLVLSSHISPPYLINAKSLPIPKVNIVSTGREGIIYKDSCQFYFLIGDISVNSTPVKFIQFPDTAHISTLEEMNVYLETESFALNKQSVFTFSAKGGILDSMTVNQFLGNGWIRFKVQLIDANTNEVLGEIYSKEYSAQNFEVSFNGSYQVNTSRIGNRTVKLKMYIMNNFNASYSIADVISENTAQLNKFQEITLDGKEQITDYSLGQNYPNPFNPSTVISYDIPQNSRVTIKIYDVLGNEIKTLVDEEKSSGRYSVEFDASSLASGTYIYRIQAGEYTSTRKMTLIK